VKVEENTQNAAHEGAAAHEEHVDPLMGIILPYANFAIFLALAIYFFRKPAKAAAAKKREAYEKLLAESKAAHAEAEQRLAEMRARQAGLDKEIADLKATAQAAAEVEAAKIVGDAERLAEHLRQEARRIAQAEVDKARAALRQEIVESVREGVTQKLKAELTGDAQLTLVRSRIGDLKSIRAEG
jgi:F-type H+-transporting ATPase subunit b